APDTTRPVPAPVGRPDSTLAASPRAEGPHIVSPPQVGDGRLWVSPRPALPTEVADVLYERSEEHTSELQSRGHLVCRLLLEKKTPDNAPRLHLSIQMPNCITTK